MAELSSHDVLMHTRMQRYFEWCDHYRTKPLQEAAVAFRYTSVTRLALGPDASSLDLMALAEMLKHDNVITSLDTSRARLGNCAAFILQDVLPLNMTLQELNMANTDLGEQGAVALARAIERSVSLQRVYLRGNRIGQEGALALARVLRRTKTLEYLDVSNNYLRVRGVHELTHALVYRAQHAR
jgi:Ran GTPase-activating protein (RanGAP) involved in mRNA processing and transport